MQLIEVFFHELNQVAWENCRHKYSVRLGDVGFGQRPRLYAYELPLDQTDVDQWWVRLCRHRLPLHLILTLYQTLHLKIVEK